MRGGLHTRGRALEREREMQKIQSELSLKSDMSAVNSHKHADAACGSLQMKRKNMPI